MSTHRPSARVRNLFRQGAQIIVDAPAQWLEEIDRAILSAPAVRAVADDKALAAALRRTNRANLLHWAQANVSDPGAPVPANLGPEPLTIGRDLVRRGLNESALQAYRIGQNTAWQRWMSLAFELASEPGELHELLEVSARSMFSFVDATVDAIAERMQHERDDLLRGTHAEKLAVVELILAGAPIARLRAENTLGYKLGQVHIASVIWCDATESDSRHLDRAAEALVSLVGAAHPLSLVVKSHIRWLWIPGAIPADPDPLPNLLNHIPGVRIAVGSTGRGLEGFRRSHLDAITTQRMLTRLNSPQRVARFKSVQLISLISQDPDRADEFVKDTLGDLESASAEIRESVLGYINAQGNAVAAAQCLYIHRNTMLRRLARAEELLPVPIHANSVNIAVALDVLRWRGPSAR